MLKRSDKGKPPYGSRSHRLGVTFVVGILVVALVLFCFSGKNQDTDSANSVKPELQFHPTVEIQNGTHLIWKIPKSPKAVLFIAHGCQRKASHFWDRSPDCPGCTGLPEEKLLARFALSRKFAVITVSSAGNCWTFGKEKSIVENIIKSWVKKHELERLPLVALGASSGGYFVSALAIMRKFEHRLQTQ